MIPEITIKVSFAPAPGVGMEPTVATVDVSPPALPEGASVVDIQPPPDVHDESLSSFAYEVPPPPAVMTVTDDVPTIPDIEGSKEPSE